jgi:hypothetical protein
MGNRLVMAAPWWRVFPQYLADAVGIFLIMCYPLEGVWWFYAMP